METYRKYFDIDPDFLPAVDSDVIKKDPNLWKKFFPHETFIKLLKYAINVIERNQKLNIWVEGAYGTGKSHAVLTLKHLLDAQEQDVRDYFEMFNLDNDLCNKFIAAKTQGKIVTVHRYGSSTIHSDNDLFLAMQESIENALKEAGIENAGPNSLRDGVIRYLSDDENKQSFEVYVKGSYKEYFGNESVDDIIRHLEEYSDQALQTLMNKIFKVANEKNIKAFSLDDVVMCQWITEVIQANGLKAIIFIWDEFTEYFDNNTHHLTGFQHVLQLSQTQPFCFIPVTHRSEAGLDDADSDKKKILDRFIKPTCIIDLPENMAFQLMGAAMRKNEDSMVRKEWENEILPDLEQRTNDSRVRIKKYAGIDDAHLRGILPIHPYAACLLKHISASFASNQRSMFDFIKNSSNDEQKGFQWFIDKFGPFEENPFLTIDLLWGFFYETGRDDLSQSIKQILDRYPSLSRQLDSDEQKVLKTILLFQAISQSTGDSVEIFLPNEKNLDFAFEGSSFDSGQAVKCAEKLIRDKIIYKKDLKDGTTLYSVLTGELDSGQIEKQKANFESHSTSRLIQDGELNDSIELPHDLKLRFKTCYSGITDFDQNARKAINDTDSRHFYIVFCLSKDASESVAMTKKIKSTIGEYPDTSVIFVDCGKIPLTTEEFEKWVENKAISAYYTGKDNNLATQYTNYAKAILSSWKKNLKCGQYVLYNNSYPSGEIINSIDTLNEEFRSIDRKRFPLSLECNYKSIDNWWIANSLQVGVECGITQTEKGTYNNKIARLSVSLAKAWNVDKYWEQHPSEPISSIKVQLNNYIENELKEHGRIAITSIYDFLKKEPYGFLPCNMTAFFMGFLLKEYVSDKYSWSDNNISDSMKQERMKEMIEEVIKLDITPNTRYRTKYLVTMTPEEKAFIEGTSYAFDIPKEYCSSVESVRDRIRGKIKTLSFPIWTIELLIDNEITKEPKEIVKSLLNDYMDLVNNTTGTKTDTDIANGIGKKFSAHKNAANDLKTILSEEKCKQGMLKYLEVYKDGELPNLAKKIGDSGQYINKLRNKIDAGDANWVWKRQTIDQQIDEVILEYKIIEETSNLLGSCIEYKDAISAWNAKCGNLKVSLETVKDYVIDILPLLSLLKEIRLNGILVESKKQNFLELLQGYGSKFNAFYTGQYELFKKACSFELQDLNDSDKEKIFTKVPSGRFADDKISYGQLVEKLVAEYKKDLGSIKLKALWKEKTSTDTPYLWSKQHKMPIQAMIPDSEWFECRSVFDTLNATNPTDKEIEKAQIYLEKFTHWNVLNDQDARDNLFKKNLLGDYAVMVKDIQEIRQYLENHVSENPYYWMGNPSINETIRKYAESKYNAKGYEEAMNKIDSMDAESVKDYLKELIKNNMKVGIQIIKNN